MSAPSPAQIVSLPPRPEMRSFPARAESRHGRPFRQYGRSPTYRLALPASRRTSPQSPTGLVLPKRQRAKQPQGQASSSSGNLVPVDTFTSPGRCQADAESTSVGRRAGLQEGPTEGCRGEHPDAREWFPLTFQGVPSVIERLLLASRLGGGRAQAIKGQGASRCRGCSRPSYRDRRHGWHQDSQFSRTSKLSNVTSSVSSGSPLAPSVARRPKLPLWRGGPQVSRQSSGSIPRRII